ncbi:MAG: hypothetical protein P4L57_08985 [Rhizomicrobium sp.]|nr:hypothetical protein [Rhizomicrobium sp.]
MSDTPDVALWPNRENYPRFRALCDDDVPPTFDEFEIAATRRLKSLAREGIHIQWVTFDPDEMAAWCRQNCGKVDSEARAQYAGFVFLSHKSRRN